MIDGCGFYSFLTICFKYDLDRYICKTKCFLKYSVESTIDNLKQKSSDIHLSQKAIPIWHPHCSTAMSTRPVRYSGFFAWFILLWPRHDHFSSWINFIRGAFWKSMQFVVTQPNQWIFQRGSNFTYLRTIQSFSHKIVTDTEILALVSMLLGINFKQCHPILGDTFIDLA